jgi:RNA polymerase sigma-70 factor, ECF subfamily
VTKEFAPREALNRQVLRATTTIGIGEIEAVYRSRIVAFRRVARAITGDAETARDVVQDAFASAISERRRYRPIGSLEAWIWRIVVNRSISERRRLTRAALHAPVVALEAPLGNGSGDAAARIAAALALLPERQRLAVFLHYYADLDYGAIGVALGITSGTVGASLHAARAALRTALVPEEAHR